jgi:hypothetical protein
VVNIKKKKSILDTLDELDKKAENSPLVPNEIDLKQYLNNRLAELLREEEIKWYQRDKRNYWRVIPTPDISNSLPMVNIGKLESSNSNMRKE